MADNITIGAITEIPIYEVRKNRNSHSIEVIVDGATHEVWVRREGGSIRLPPELADHPLASKIKAIAGMALLDRIMPGIKLARRTRRVPIRDE